MRDLRCVLGLHAGDTHLVEIDDGSERYIGKLFVCAECGKHKLMEVRK